MATELSLVLLSGVLQGCQRAAIVDTLAVAAWLRALEPELGTPQRGSVRACAGDIGGIRNELQVDAHMYQRRALNQRATS